MPKISSIKAEETTDSRGNSTLLATCLLASGALGSASVPSGTSTGRHEACELRDPDGKGVQKAIKNVNEEIVKAVMGKEVDQTALDELLIKLDGTKNKSRLGANAILGVSLAFARATAKERNLELYEHLANLYFRDENARKYKIPEPAFNVLNGGKHAKNGLAFQEFLLIPIGFNTIMEKVEVTQKIIVSLKDLLLQNGQSIELGDEGGFAPKLKSNEEALEYLGKAISAAGYDTQKVKLGIDVAASSFWKNEHYAIEGKMLNAGEMISMYEKLCGKHEIISIEDGLNEEDFAGFAQMNKKLGGKINIVGDDLTVTNVELIKKAIENKSINTLLIKPNQIGTLSETLAAIKLARENNIKIFVSHRSGETVDSFIADLSVAVGAEFIKAGAPTRPERMAKYNRLIEIEKEISRSKI
ncbi:phosphopyruvate hydratase [Candidatus Nomurabacteria bacterium RIFCSPLOWO2_02_FULL_44_12]|uniref:Enolase n=1 Tax=Candidatus Nomurabacteria bacterium RIFCSPLOWO2_12_FULL_44_11 TaxID=1801796 RepID=A0A1F6Y5F2_9BACT|nr:MAG: phosphopyruvate hydratase [Candidatus Nomurabacteria bacterium RIFCSPHIGHO2_12_FULL_44_22b]OGJ01607.1 MAG: phosphopyruvate hydratase [Candidatus Nomurabacteria bacterium RIFCSPLOWO2_12_FULL_44_11]OGJ08222.1 MAG: phosphopyruvate hydratase [Candidatus Nomurabacteria bacterium RIFCSPLOWO2_02_FULL_44_12]